MLFFLFMVYFDTLKGFHKRGDVWPVVFPGWREGTTVLLVF